MNKWYIKEASETIKKAISEGLDVAGEVLKGEHTKAANGNYGDYLEAVDEGNYKNSFEFDRPSDSELRMGNLADYAAHLEFGTIKMRPRPNLRVTPVANKDKITEILQASIGEKIGS